MAAIWKLKPPLAESANGPFTVRLDLRRPDQGLSVFGREGAALTGWNLLGVQRHPAHNSPAADPADCYERGTDLIAVYDPTADSPVRVQIYWRAVAEQELPGGGHALDLQVSVQTPRWEACPRLTVQSSIPAGEPLRLLTRGDGGGHAWITRQANEQHQAITDDAPESVAGCILVRPPESEWSYAEMIHPADARLDQIGVRSIGKTRSVTIEHTLFDDALEKGVILRARLRGVILPRHADEAAAAAVYHRFIESALPLTT